MDPSSQHPVYSGTSPQPARTPHALVPDSFAMQETWQQGMAQQTQNAIDFRDAAIDRIEYTIDQNRQTQTDQALAAMQADFIAKSQLPNGAGGFYDANGAFNSGQFESWLNSHLSKLDKLKGGYIRPASQQKADQALAEIKQKASERMQINVLQQLGSRAQTALKENIAALQAAGQFDQVDAVVKGAPDYAISQAGRDAILADNENLRVTTGVQNAILAGNKADALKLYKAAMKLPSLSPMAKAKLASAIKGVQASVSTNVRKEKDPATGKEKTVIVPPELPADAPSYVVSFYKQNYEGIQAGVSVLQAQDIVSRMVRDSITLQENEQGAEDQWASVERIAKMLGVDREYAMAKVKKQRSAMKTCKELKIDNILPKIGKNDKYDDYDGVVRFDNLFSEAENNRYYALVDEVDKASASDPEGKDENTAVAIAYLAKEEERRMNRMRGFISSVYQRVGDWEEQNKNNNVTNPGKVYAILNIIDEELASPSYKDLEGNLPASFSYSDEALDLAAEYADPLGDQRRKEALERRKDYDEDVKNTAMARAKEASLRETEAQMGVSIRKYDLGCTVDASNSLPDTDEVSYIAVPKGSSRGRKSVIIRNGNLAKEMEVREMDVQNPTLSFSAMVDMGLHTNNSVRNIILDDKGNAQIVQPSEIPSRDLINAIPSSQDTYFFDDTSDSEKNVGTSEKQLALMCSFIMQSESNGSLAVHKLPAGDGGGEYEVAGLNQRDDNAELQHVIALMKEGKRDEAMQYVAAAYVRKTQSTVDWLHARGINNPAIEYMARDMAFNHGNGGARSILNRALAANKGGDVTSLVTNIYTARAAKFKAIAANNPAKAKFLKGWLNRNDDMLANCLALI